MADHSLISSIIPSPLKKKLKKYPIVVSSYLSVLEFFDSIHKAVSAVTVPVKLRRFHRTEAETVVEFAMSHRAIRPLQLKQELLRFAAVVEQHRPGLVLEIGTFNGGTMFVMSRLARPDATIISVDLPGGKYGGGYSESHMRIIKRLPSSDQTLHLLRADSHSVETREQVSHILGTGKLDLLFIDGDHTYNGVKADFEMYAPLVRSGGIVAFHDIAHHPPELCSDVDVFWQELKSTYQYEEIIHDPNQGWAGIGILHL